MRTVVALVSLFISTYGYCASTSSKAIMEQVPATNNTIQVDVTNRRVNISTRTYTGGITNVGLHVSSNVVIDTPTVQNAVVIYATGSIVLRGSIVGTSATPTRQIFLSGSGTYTTPAGAKQLKIRMYGGGGGGGGAGGSGGNGGASSFGSIVASSGIAGIHATGTSCNGGGAGGTGGVGGSGVFVSSSVVRWPGQPGGCSEDATGTNNDPSGDGGSSVFGGGGAPSANQDPQAAAIGGIGALPNTGGGGSGCSNDGGCSGGGGGESVELIINTPSATYPYIVGAAGSAGGGSPGGGSGGSGQVLVDEY